MIVAIFWLKKSCEITKVSWLKNLSFKWEHFLTFKWDSVLSPKWGPLLAQPFEYLLFYTNSISIFFSCLILECMYMLQYKVTFLKSLKLLFS